MRGPRLFLGLLAMAILTAAAGPPSFAGDAPATAARLLVWPEIQVSRDRTLPHYEMMVAANPRDPRNLIGISITRAGRNPGSSACRAFATFDGGSTWTPSELPGQIDRGGIDPVVAFDRDGVAWAVVLGGAATPAKNGRSDALLVYRSGDGGRSWSEPVAVGVGDTHDAPSIAVDDSSGPFHGRLYVGTNFGMEEPKNGVLRSADGGRSFQGPVDLPEGGPGKVCMNEPLLVLRDGTLWAPVTCMDDVPASYASTGHRTLGTAFATSSDGGATFSPLAWTPLALDEDMAALWEIHAQRFALDPGSPRFGGRIYAVWGDYRWGAPRTVLASSSDGGKTWSEPRAIDPAAPAAARQFQATVAVDRRGVVGVAWFDTRYAGGGYDEMFAASLDGGATFSAPVRISAASSPFDAPGNLDASPISTPSQGGVRLFVSMVGNRWPAGGDYQGLVAAADGEGGGSFHPFWADARSGTFQILSARVRVLEPGEESSPVIPPGLVETAITDRVDLLFDPAGYDVATRTGRLPIRLRNRSSAPIWGPVRLDVESFLPSAFYYRRTRDVALEVIGAANGERGPGAQLEFTPALGPYGRLDPGEVSGSVVLELRYAVRDPRPELQVTVHGRVEPPK